MNSKTKKLALIFYVLYTFSFFMFPLLFKSLIPHLIAIAISLTFLFIHFFRSKGISKIDLIAIVFYFIIFLSFLFFPSILKSYIIYIVIIAFSAILYWFSKYYNQKVS